MQEVSIMAKTEAKTACNSAPRVRPVSELVLVKPIQTPRGATNIFRQTDPYVTSLVADYDGHFVSIKMTGKGTQNFPFDKVERWSPAMGTAKAE